MSSRGNWILWCLVIATLAVQAAMAETTSTPPDTVRKGITIHVSKLGDNSDGSSWAKAFHTIQAALLKVPDDRGGHRVIIRPDTYVEANLYPLFKGAPGAYNVIEGDVDGRAGSGATGWVVIDTSCPDKVVRTNPKGGAGNPGFIVLPTGGPERGFKCIDWWGPWRCDPEFSGAIWDRWVFRHLYCTGSEGGIGWDMTTQDGCEFSAIVEDCVGIGRFAGAAVMAHVNRPAEPVLFRRCYFMNLDWWGDAGAVYVRGSHTKMPDTPDAIFEDCTLVSPDNAYEESWKGYPGYTRVKFKDCRLIVLNFSQPHGTPSGGIIHTAAEGKQLHVDLEDCTLMGFKVFGCEKGEVSYTVKGNVRAYVQFQQPTPKGFERLAYWPVDVFSAIAIPSPGRAAGGARPENPKLSRIPVTFGTAMENTPVVFKGQPLLVLNHRDDSKNNTDPYTKKMHLYIKDLATGQELARFGEGHSFVNGFVNGEEFNVFASEGSDRDWFKSIYRFRSTDLKTWQRSPAVALEGDEHLFNCSVCRDDQGYLMAYESNKPVQWSFRFARSKDLNTWTKVPDITFADRQGQSMCACPVIRYVAPYYYVIYTAERGKGAGAIYEYASLQSKWVPVVARSKDLVTWALSPTRYPVLEPCEGEGPNCSDLDLFEYKGNTYIYYATGDQATWGSVRVAMYAGPLKEMLEAHFPPNVPTTTFDARKGQYLR